MKNGMKSSNGITLIALIVTIIVLVILAGSSIAMLGSQNGVLNRAQEAKIANTIGAFNEQLRLAQLSAKTSIMSQNSTKAGYMATTSDNLASLAQEVAKGMDVNAIKGNSGSTAIAKEKYTVAYYLDTPGNDSTDGTGYIVVWFTNNGLRSSVSNRAETITSQGLKDVAVANNSRNQLTLVSVIKVENYSCVLAKEIGVTSTTDGGSDLQKAKLSLTSINNKFTF